MKLTFKSTLGLLGTSLAISSFIIFNPVYKPANGNTATSSGTTTTADSVNHKLFAPGAQVELIAKQFKFTEGPAADKQGNVFFTDQPNDKIWKYSTDGQLTLFMDKTGRSNGMYFDKKGNLLSCADENNQIWAISPDKKVTVLLKDLDGKKFNGPNDLWVHPKTGTIYFTDPFYPRDYWTRKTPELAKQNVYYLPQGKQEPVLADDNLEQPNGIIGSADGKTLFVADIKANKTYKYQIAPDGKLTNRQLFVEQGSDGMTLDSQGNLYLCGKGVTVYSPAGQKLVHIPVPAGWTANATFGGKDRNMLFITAMEGVYKLPMLVKGI
ncbi:SMP-30/gluconolactonase/LRE family protein [Adhaeribacter swui]|uniref:SMP-30/gluconolactonase/LRE family protein n=1 Tax=Adhaeribacter swui TaxID=2086471 RepID=A0A7G7GC62_9BACT|nr:SMP-30/gluconolactonase/LRE family protein [Adhaeribacter swui]QNF34746.1 SMP-30/gluconolactonase/LRE family protein [Adhaeribacter swui]